MRNVISKPGQPDYGLAAWPFWEWGFRAKESALMFFPKAQFCAFVILALGGSLYLCPALSQDRLLPGPSDSETEGGLWPERLALSCLRDGWRRRSILCGEEEKRYQLQNRTCEPGHRWQGRVLSKWKAVRNMLESASRVMEADFLFLMPFSNTYFEKLFKGGGN